MDSTLGANNNGSGRFGPSLKRRKLDAGQGEKMPLSEGFNALVRLRYAIRGGPKAPQGRRTGHNGSTVRAWKRRFGVAYPHLVFKSALLRAKASSLRINLLILTQDGTLTPRQICAKA